MIKATLSMEEATCIFIEASKTVRNFLKSLSFYRQYSMINAFI